MALDSKSPHRRAEHRHLAQGMDLPKFRRAQHRLGQDIVDAFFLADDAHNVRLGGALRAEDFRFRHVTENITAAATGL
jgi:hypothetical protein